MKKSATAIILKKYEEVSITKILGYGSLFFLLAGLFVHGYQEDAFSMMYINAGMTPCSQILQNNEEDFMASMGVIFSIIDSANLKNFSKENIIKDTVSTQLSTLLENRQTFDI